jgi:hypothetical protein
MTISSGRNGFLLFIAVGVLACVAASRTSPSTASTALIHSPECYSLAYTDPVKSAEPKLFPVAFALLPGSDSGSVIGRPHPAFDPREWPAMTTYSWWKKLPPDSIKVNFSGNYEAIVIHVQRRGSRVVGRATYLSDIVEPDPQPSMHVEGTKEVCPVGFHLPPNERCS